MEVLEEAEELELFLELLFARARRSSCARAGVPGALGFRGVEKGALVIEKENLLVSHRRWWRGWWWWWKEGGGRRGGLRRNVPVIRTSHTLLLSEQLQTSSEFRRYPFWSRQSHRASFLVSVSAT